MSHFLSSISRRVGQFGMAPAQIGRKWDSPAFLPQLSFATKLRWMVDDVAFENQRMIAKGWIISTFHPIDSARMVVNDTQSVKPLLHADPDLQELFAELPENTCYRFVLDISLPESGFISLKYLPSGSSDGAVVDSTMWCILHPDEEQIIPGGSNIFRVIGSSNDFAYKIGGATVANRIDQYVRRIRAKPVSEIGKILDWGCGCGRVTRYLQKLGCQSLYGVDVDEANVNWSMTHLPGINFSISQLLPPLPFEQGTFDLIIGVSIFTHLREGTQDAWLQELARVLKPDGLAIVTVMTQNQAALQGATSAFLTTIRRDGFVVTDDNNQLRLGDDAENYYVNVYHSIEYIFEKWQREFQVVDVVEFLGAHQDAIVLRRKR